MYRFILRGVEALDLSGAFQLMRCLSGLQVPGSEAPVWQVGPRDLLEQGPSEPARHLKIACETVRERSSAESAISGSGVCGQRWPTPRHGVEVAGGW